MGSTLQKYRNSRFLSGFTQNYKHVDMADAILALKVMSGMDSTGVSLSGDVNADGKIGLAEVIYILQYVAGLRP